MPKESIDYTRGAQAHAAMRLVDFTLLVFRFPREKHIKLIIVYGQDGYNVHRIEVIESKP